MDVAFGHFDVFQRGLGLAFRRGSPEPIGIRGGGMLLVAQKIEVLRGVSVNAGSCGSVFLSFRFFSSSFFPMVCKHHVYRPHGESGECRGLGHYAGYCKRHKDTSEAIAAIAAEAAAAAAAEAARNAAAAEAERVARVAKNEDLLARCPNLTASEYLTLSEDLGLAWATGGLVGYAAIVAYKALRHAPIQDPRLPEILGATLQVLFLTKKYNPTKQEYREATREVRISARNRLKNAVAPLQPVMMTAEFLLKSDPMRQKLEERLRLEELRMQEEAAAAAAEAAAAAAAEAAARAAEAAARAAFAARLRAEPVVFQRDPEGGVDLRAFAADAQSVHRSSVQSATERSVRLLLERDVPTEQRTLEEVSTCFQVTDEIRWGTPERKERAVHEVAADYLDTMAFSVRYGDVLDRVWTFIQRHAETLQLTFRLAQEIHEGLGMCSNGTMARLVIVLQGYDETLFTEPPKEAFQEMMARLRERPFAERGPAAAALFEEYRIAEGERRAWLEALED